MSHSVVVTAPAKLNLTLEVTGRREDGYHFLRSVMQSIDLCDTITITPQTGGEIQVACSNPVIPTDERNLCYKAAAAFFREAGISQPGLLIDMACQIPPEAGLGAGSADAAGVLVGLNDLYGSPFSTEELCHIGVGLGADVPFCIVGGTMLAEGVGEIFTPLPLLSDCPIVVAKPARGALTAECFANYDRRGSDKIPRTDEMIAALVEDDLPMAAGLLCNVLEESSHIEDVEQIRAVLLEQGAMGASMTGSGTAVFGFFESAAKAHGCVRALEEIASYVGVVHPVSHGAVLCRRVRNETA